MNIVLHKNKCLIILLAVFLILSSSTSCSFGELSSTDIYEKHEGAVVLVRTYDHRGELIAHGTGFNIEPTGTIVTNYHVIEDAYDVTADFGDKIEYEVQGYRDYDKKADLIVLDINADKTKLPTIPLGDPTKVNIGEEVYVIGNPLGVFEKTFSSGKISQIVESKEPELPEVVYQLTAPVSPGSSGSPVINNKGEVVAVVTASVPLEQEAQLINFAVSADSVTSLIITKSIHKLEKPTIQELEKPTIDPVIEFLWSEFDYFMSREDFNNALMTLDEIIEISNNDLEQLRAYKWSGIIYSSRLGDPLNGLFYFTLAILGYPDVTNFPQTGMFFESDPSRAGLALIYIRRGKVYLDLGRTEQAIEDFKKAIELEPATGTGAFTGLPNEYKYLLEQ